MQLRKLKNQAVWTWVGSPLGGPFDHGLAAGLSCSACFLARVERERPAIKLKKPAAIDGKQTGIALGVRSAARRYTSVTRQSTLANQSRAVGRRKQSYDPLGKNMNISTLIARYQGEADSARTRYDRARQEITSILNSAQAANRTNLTKTEDDRCELLLDTADRAKAEMNSAETALAKAKAVRDEDAEYDRQSRISIPTAAGMRARGQSAIIPAAGLTGAGGSYERAESPEWIRASDGRNAVVARNQRFADHEVVRAEIERSAERDRTIIGQHGDFGQYLRAMTTSGASAIVPTSWSADVIDKARNASVVYEAGAQTVVMDQKTVQIGRLTQDPAPAFKNEGSPVTPGDLTYDYVQLVASSLTALVVTSLEFLQDAPNSSSLIQDALGKAMALELDKAALFGQLGATGTNDEGATYGLAAPYPKGILKNLIDNAAGNIIGTFPTNGTAQTPATPWNELLAVYYKPLRGNEKVTAIVSNTALQQQYNGMYNTLYDPIRMPQVLADTPWLVTNAIPSFTRGTMTSRATDVFAGDFSQVLIGQRLGLEVRVLTERYAENGQVGLLAYWRGDVQVARPAALACYRALQGAL